MMQLDITKLCSRTACDTKYICMARFNFFYVDPLCQKLLTYQEEEGGYFSPVCMRTSFMHVPRKYADKHIMHKPNSQKNTEVYPVETILDGKVAAVNNLWSPRRFLE